jgi:hypothetical protein
MLWHQWHFCYLKKKEKELSDTDGTDGSVYYLLIIFFLIKEKRMALVAQLALQLFSFI